MKKIIIAVVMALSMILPTYAADATIDHPRIVLHKKKHTAQIKWYQYVQAEPKLVIAFKVTNTRHNGLSTCSEVDFADYMARTGQFKYCYDLFTERLPESRWITVTDKNWNKKDRYYIIQYDFTSHNSPYGPYEAK